MERAQAIGSRSGLPGRSRLIEIAPYVIDDTLFQKTLKDGKRRINVYVPEQVQVVIGRGSKPDAELHMDACMQDGVPVLRRRGGGCAVVLDPGNVVVAVTEHAPGFGNNKAHLQRLSQWLMQGLERLGVMGLERSGISDLTWGDRKVGGSCLHRSGDTLLYTASLLVNPDVSSMERYLKQPPREPDYRRGRSHSEFVGKLSPHLWTGHAEDLARQLMATFPA